MNLTTQQICDICDLIGIDYEQPDAGMLETEIWIGEGTISGENGEPYYHGLIAYDADYPEEGAIALERA